DGFVQQRHALHGPATGRETTCEHDVEPRGEPPVTVRTQLLQAILQHLDAGPDLAAADGDLAPEAVADIEIGPERLRFCAGDEPVQVLLGGAEVADPQQTWIEFSTM